MQTGICTASQPPFSHVEGSRWFNDIPCNGCICSIGGALELNSQIDLQKDNLQPCIYSREKGGYTTHLKEYPLAFLLMKCNQLWDVILAIDHVQYTITTRFFRTGVEEPISV